MEKLLSDVYIPVSYYITGIACVFFLHSTSMFVDVFSYETWNTFSSEIIYPRVVTFSETNLVRLGAWWIDGHGLTDDVFSLTDYVGIYVRMVAQQ